jgi:hypothetical protein
VARQDKKERKRLKRKQKQLKLRKDRGMSVYQRLARTPGAMQCSITRGWKDIGEGNLIVSRDAPGGGKVVLAFLIDFWCVGLKDAFGREGLTSAEVASFRERTEGVPIADDQAKRLVAAALRFSRQNGFKLPHKYERFMAAVGVSSADVDAADLSDFGLPGGKLRYVGPIGELRRKLIGSVDDFLARGDVEFVMAPDAGAFDDEYFDEFAGEEDGGDVDESDSEELEADEGEGAEVRDQLRPEFADMVDEIADRAEAAVRQWLLENGRAPHPRLAEGVSIALSAAMVEWTARESPESRGELPDITRVMEADEDPAGLAEAVEQVVDFVRQYDTPQRFVEAFALPKEG